jgi:TRAP-type uncharacterized transport system substrate-binding protein
MVRRRLRLSWGIIAFLLALMAVGAAAAVYNNIRITYRVAVGPEGGEGQRFFAAINPIFAAESSIIRLAGVPTSDLQASAKALESGDVDLAIIRPDVAVPANGRTVMILRREPVLLIVPANSKVEKVTDLSGKAIGVVTSSTHDAGILDTILNYYQHPGESVRRVTLAPSAVADAVKQKRVAVIVVIGPMGPGLITDVVATIAKAGNGPPNFLAVEEAEAIAKRWPTLEKLEIARGALQGNPPVPDESITTIAVSSRLVARSTMYDWPAGEIARLLSTNKAKIAAELPFAHQIEAPDTDKDLVLPAHPGAAAYVNGEQKSFFDMFESLFWMAWIVCTLIGVSYAAVRSRINRHKHDATTEATDRVLKMLLETRGADADRLEAMENEADRVLAWSLQRWANDAIDDERFRFLTLAIDHLRQAIERQRQRPRAPVPAE